MKRTILCALLLLAAGCTSAAGHGYHQQAPPPQTAPYIPPAPVPPHAPA